MAGLQDRGSRPHRLRQPTAPEVIERIESLRRQRLPGKEIAATVGVSAATVSRVLKRLGLVGRAILHRSTRSGGQLLPQGGATKAMLLSSRFGEKIRADIMFVPTSALRSPLRSMWALTSNAVQYYYHESVARLLP